MKLRVLLNEFFSQNLENSFFLIYMFDMKLLKVILLTTYLIGSYIRFSSTDMPLTVDFKFFVKIVFILIFSPSFKFYLI
jgi:hypothetical protein